MGDPNPNHFLVHSALVLPPLVVQRSSYEAGEFCIEKNPEVRVSRWTGNHRSIDLPILGWLEKMSGSTVPAVVDVVPVLGRFLEWLFLKSCMKQEKETHTHTHTGSSVFNNLSLSPEPLASRKKSIPPKNPPPAKKKNILPTAQKTHCSLRQLISHCPDLLELPTLCGSSITGMASSASQIASWGSQVAIACGEGSLEREMVVTWETHLPLNAEVNAFGRG